MKYPNLKSAARSTIVIALMASGFAAHGGGDVPSKASNIGSIVNTRHNLTQSFLPASGVAFMDMVRSNYGEVCVYCHTPHGASSTVPAPLWNRTTAGNTHPTYNYTLYNIPLTSGQAPTEPGVSSLTCLSCHDGSVAIDSIINMPTSSSNIMWLDQNGNIVTGYGYSQTMEVRGSTVPQINSQQAFLNTWTNDPNFPYSSSHLTLDKPVSGCMNCHSTGIVGAGFITAPDFAAFLIGKDLTNDHPIGVQLPDTNIYDFNAPTATNASLKFYDTNGNSRPDPSEIRFYNTGAGYEVECASCHDPHGVPSAGPGSLLKPSFLRVSNAGSAVCLTCHNK